jgi:hypothetical protein
VIHRLRGTAIVVATLALLTSACGAARAPVTSFEALPSRLEIGKTVVVDDAAGQQHRGRLVRISPDRIAFRDNGTERALASGDVIRIAVCCDSLANGAAIGLGIGVLSGLLALGQVLNPYEATNEQVFGSLILFGGLGAAAGAGIDASNHKDELVYLAPGVTARFSGGPKRPLLTVTVTW